MKNLLIPTDLSHESMYAENFGIEVSKKSRANIHFLCSKFSKIQNRSLNNEVISNFQFDLDKLVRRANNYGINAYGYFKTLENSYEIEKKINHIKFDYVIMSPAGSEQANSKIDEIAIRAIRHSSIPLLFIKTVINSLKLKKLIFISDFQDENIVNFEPVIKLAELFDLEIYLLYINTPSNFKDTEVIERQQKKFKKLYSGNCYLYVYNSEEIVNGITKFSNKIDPDFIAITNRSKNLERTIFPNVAEKLIDNLSTPIISINLL